MNSTINRLKIIFLVIFSAAVVGIWAYQIVWGWPKQRCEAHGGWWAGKWMKCATPLPMETLAKLRANAEAQNRAAGLATEPAPATTPTPAK